MPSSEAIAVVLRMVEAFEQGDLAAFGELLAEDFTGHITTADGGVRDIDRTGYVEAVRAMDVRSANLRLDLANVVEVGPSRVLAMLVVHAARGGATLHNFSGQLASVSNGKVTELWMVEALPAESDAFWSQRG
jgi:ketosteroid isomerase-like protein